MIKQLSLIKALLREYKKEIKKKKQEYDSFDYYYMPEEERFDSGFVQGMIYAKIWLEKEYKKILHKNDGDHDNYIEQEEVEMKQIIFHDIENDKDMAGLLLQNGDCICLCCGGLFESEDLGETWYIVSELNNWISLNEVLLEKIKE